MTTTENKTTKRCEQTNATGFSWSVPFSQSRLSSICTDAVTQVVVAGRDAWRALSKATSNNRTYLGLILILIVAPLSGVAYLILFDETVRGQVHYYENYFYLFYMLSPHIHMMLTLTGVFLLFTNTRKSMFLMVPVGYHAAKVLWLIQVTSNAELNGFVPLAFWLTGGATAGIWLFMFEYLMNLHYHKRTRPIATAQAVLQSAHLDNETKIRLVLNEINTYKALK